jgi:outer membrane protein
VKAVWVDADFADYYAGVRAAEVRPGRPFFQGSSTLNAGVAIGVARPLGKSWVVLGRAEFLSLGAGVRDSAVIGEDTMSFALVGLARQF